MKKNCKKCLRDKEQPRISGVNLFYVEFHIQWGYSVYSGFEIYVCTSHLEKVILLPWRGCFSNVDLTRSKKRLTPLLMWSFLSLYEMLTHDRGPDCKNYITGWQTDEKRKIFAMTCVVNLDKVPMITVVSSSLKKFMRYMKISCVLCYTKQHMIRTLYLATNLTFEYLYKPVILN